MSSSIASNFPDRINTAEQKFQEDRELSPPRSPAPKKVNSLDVKGSGGVSECLKEQEYSHNIYIDDEDCVCGPVPNTQHGTISPPDTNPNTPSRPGAQLVVRTTITPDNTPEGLRVREWQEYSPESFRDHRLLCPGEERGRSRSRSPSSNRSPSTNAYYHDAHDHFSPSPRPSRLHRRSHDDASSMSSHLGPRADNDGRFDDFDERETVYYTPSQSPSHFSRILTHADDARDGDDILPLVLPTGEFPFTEYDRHDEEYPVRQVKKFDRVWATREN